MLSNMEKRKKILLMYDFFSEHGGIERIMLFQAKSLRKEGYEVSFAFAYVDEELKKERLKDFEVIEYSPLFYKNETLQISSSIFLPNIINKFKDFDLIICHSFPASYLALKAKRKFKIPYLLHLHHPPQFLYNTTLNWAKNSFKRKFSFVIGLIFGPILRSFDRYCVKNADDYFVESKAVQRVIKNTYNLTGTILYPTISTEFKPTKNISKIKSKFKIDKDFILGSGRIIQQKRFDYLLNSVNKLKEKDIPIILAGKWDSKAKKELENLSKNKNLRIIFTGPLELDELIQLYSAAKLTVLTCPKEWFGLVPVESVACGTPVVAWADNFGPEEVILNGINGYLAEPYSEEDMAKKIEYSLAKKWDKNKLKNSISKFTEKEQSKILLKKIKNLLN